MSSRFLFFLIFLYSLLSNAEIINNGIQRQVFENGNPKYEISYKNKLKHGKEIFWYESGKKKMESHFVNGIEEGSWIQWHKNGQIKLKII